MKIAKYNTDFTCLFVLLIIPLFKPFIVLQSGNIDVTYIYRAWQLASLLGSLVLFAFSRHNEQNRFYLKYYLLAISLPLIVLLSTLINNGSFWIWYDIWMPIIGASSLACATFNIYSRELLLALLIVTGALSSFNLFSMILFPQGVISSSVFFYGNRNGAYSIVFPSITCSYLLDLRRRSTPSFTTFTFAVIGALQITLGGSSTSCVALAMLVFGVLLIQCRNIRRFLNGYATLSISITGFIFFVVLRLHEHFSFVVTDLLHKSLSLSERTPMWDLALNALLRDRPIIGFGATGYDQLVVNNVQYYGTHNMCLEVFFIGGILGAACFFLLLFSCARALYSERNNLCVTFISVMLGSYCIIGCMESIFEPSFYFLLLIGVFISFKISNRGKANGSFASTRQSESKLRSEEPSGEQIKTRRLPTDRRLMQRTS